MNSRNVLITLAIIALVLFILWLIGIRVHVG
jgi:hypothetical protein